MELEVYAKYVNGEKNRDFVSLTPTKNEIVTKKLISSQKHDFYYKKKNCF